MNVSSNIFKDIKTNNLYEHTVIGNKTRVNQVTTEYNKRLDLIKTLIEQNAYMLYSKCWFINETNEANQDLIIHYFNVLKQDVYVLSISASGLKIRSNDIKYAHTYPKLNDLVKEYLTEVHELFIRE